jgi:hypothetical protein
MNEERKICTECKWYPKSFLERLFNLEVKYKYFAKCNNPQCMSNSGEKQFCDIEREFNITGCTSKGIYFEKRDENG